MKRWMGQVLLNNVGGFPISRLPRVVATGWAAGAACAAFAAAEGRRRPYDESGGRRWLWWVSRKCGRSLMLEETACCVRCVARDLFAVDLRAAMAMAMAEAYCGGAG